ncbi:Y-family DNA polymerase [Billgrantia antri]|uniref:Y-family DNA polymerase n=1 Tax=Billgrantia antri TaxID=2846777 RepID=UPI003B21F789
MGVLSNNDGCVIALSNELKATGTTMGTPAFEIQHLVRQGRIHLLSSNYELYGDMSQRVQSVLEEFSPGVEPYSIDEMFVRFGGFTPNQMLEHARQLHDLVRQYTGIPVCVGVAPTRTLAKFANRAAKKIPAYRGVCVLKADSAETKALLQRFELGDLWAPAGGWSSALPCWASAPAGTLPKPTPSESAGSSASRSSALPWSCAA